MAADANMMEDVPDVAVRSAVSRSSWARAVVLLLAILLAVLVVQGMSSRLEILGATCEGVSCAPQQLSSFEASQVGDAGVSLHRYALTVVALEAAATAGWFAMAGILLLTRRQDDVKVLAAVSMVTFGATFSGFLDALAGKGDGWAALTDILNWMGFVSLTGFLLLFPDGRFASRRDRWLLAVSAALFALIYAAPGNILDPKTSLPGVLLVLGIVGLAVASQVTRYRRVSGPIQRQQAKWVVAGVIALVIGFAVVIVLDAINQQVYGFSVPLYAIELILFAGVKLVLPASLVLAIRRHRLWDIDALVNRAVVYASLTIGVLGIYVLVVGYLGEMFRTDGNMTVSLVATGVVAVIFQPMHDYLQRSVNRLMFGERDDPYTVIARLGDRLEAAAGPDSVLPTVVGTIRDALRVPFVAIHAGTGADSVVAASSGTSTGEALRVPLMARGELVGELVVAPRDAGASWARADLRLLNELGRQVGSAVQGLVLTRELQRSREQLVRSREEERRRLRDDLHDELAPVLASLSFTAATARALVDRDPEGARRLMTDVQQGTRSAISEVRRIVYDLRPPALDDLGLVGALMEQARHYSLDGTMNPGEGERPALLVDVRAGADLSDIPAAVEVAAYRIVLEALANVARHSGATRCDIDMALVDERRALQIDVVDNGRGIPSGARRGVGLTSMMQRAVEIGGTFQTLPVEPSGTRVQAWLPMSKEEG